jgi:hypothetical protein
MSEPTSETRSPEPDWPGEPPPPPSETDTGPVPRTASSSKVRFRGRWTCKCVATSLPLVEQAMKNKGIIKNNVDIFQMGYNTGGVAASAGTHNGGGNTDVGQYSDAALKEWREWGWTQQRRTRAQGFDPHGHGWPKGCPHLSSGAKYQASEWQAGRNGLKGRGPITGPGPTGKNTPTWTQGIKNHKSSKPSTPAKPPAAKGVLGMSKNVYYRKEADFPLKGDGQWHDLPISDKDAKAYSVILGPNNTNMLSATVRIGGMKAGEKADISFRLIEWANGKGKEKSVRAPVTATSVNGKSVSRNAGWSGAVPKGCRLRISVRTSAVTAVVESCAIQGVKE